MSDCRLNQTTYKRSKDCIAKRELASNGTTNWYRCSYCKKPVEPGDEFCHRCGSRLAD